MTKPSRATFYRRPAGESAETLALMRLIDETFLECPFYGARQMVRHLRRLGRAVGRRRVRRLMRKIGLSPIDQAPRTSEPHPAHKTYPYLLRKLVIERPNHVWCADLTYIPMRRGFLYLVAVIDWATRKVLAWRLSNTMEADFCARRAEGRDGRPWQARNLQRRSGQPVHRPRLHRPTWRTRAYASRWTGPGRWMDKVFIERLWRSLKYECVFLNAFETGAEARTGIGRWIDFYNQRRPHSALGERTPDEAYAIEIQQQNLAA